jgi:predicted O-methyltransferase YrrM
MKYENPKVYSSYRENDIGKTLYDLVIKLKPKTIVEFGTLHGYSAIAMAMACQENKVGHVVSYDLWNSYRHTHGEQCMVQDQIAELGLEKYITLEQGDLKHWDGSGDFVHIDVSNGGDTLKMIKSKNPTGVVVFEGGTVERDRVKWMIKYNRPTMGASGVRYEIINPAFPGLSKLI